MPLRVRLAHTGGDNPCGPITEQAGMQGEKSMWRVEMRGIVKEFSGVRVLKGVDFLAKPGTVHALVGENGAGKSTLIKILSGVYTSTQGTVSIDGKQARLNSVSDALREGISVIHQEVNVVPTFTVAENVFLNAEPVRHRVRVVDYPAMIRRTQEIMEQFGVDIDARRRGRSLSVAEKQLTMIARALLFSSRVLIMDEPTSSLPDDAVEGLFRAIDRLRAQGMTIIYISHRLDEVLRIADYITVLRDGTQVGTLKTSETTIDGIVELMLDRNLDKMFPPKRMQPGGEALRLIEVSDGNAVRSASLHIRRGEVVGLTGLLGAGKTELVRLIYGAGTHPLTSGQILLDGSAAVFRNPREALSAGVALVPENRREQGLVLGDTVLRNVSLASLPQFADPLGRMNHSLERSRVGQLWETLQIRGTGLNQRVRYLSGGNQQKVVVAKCLCATPKLLILDEPTKGIDVGAKAELYRAVSDLAAQGCAVLWVTMEIPEAVGVCSRVYVMRGGRVVAEFPTEQSSVEDIYALAAGATSAHEVSSAG